MAGRLSWLPVPLLVALAAAGMALGRRSGRAIAWLALGMLWGDVRWVAPREAFLSLSPARPVALAGAVAGCWEAGEEGESAWLEVDRVQQGHRLRRTAARVRVHLPGDGRKGSCGGRLAIRGYLKPPHAYRNAVVSEVGSWSVWVKSPRLATLEGEPGLLARLGGAARRRLFPAVVDERKPQAGVALARALLLGDGGALPARQREAMRRVGLAHLIAVSGLNVGMVAGIFFVLLFPAPRALRLGGTLAGILAYALLVGPLPSLLRALLMAAAVLGGLLLRRLPAAVNGLALACLVLVLLDPAWVDDLGFQLSLAATVGLLALAVPLRHRLAALGPLAAPLGVTLAAQLATLPWALAAFGRLSPAAPLANLLAVPWAAIALAVALAWATLRLVVGAAADPLLSLLDLLAAPLGWLEKLPASPWITWPQQAPWVVAWGLTVWLGWWILFGRRASSLAAGLLAAAAALWACGPRAASPDPELVMLDVGQGDALLLRDGRATLLVDGGGWRRPGFGGRVLVPALAALGVRQLDAVAVTHPDSDHCGGASDLLRELPVREVWAPAGMAETPCGIDLRASRVRYRELVAGAHARIGRWRLRVMGPERFGVGPDNRRSLVLLAEALGRRALLTGDLDAAGEAGLLRRWRGGELACDLLKVAHHGSPGSSIPPFLRAARPQLALVSVGASNAYGHPSPKVIAALEVTGANVLRTDRDGMVRVRWGRRWRIRVTAP